MYISANVVPSREGWKLRIAEASHLRAGLFDAVDLACGATNHRLICRYRWGLRLLSFLGRDRLLLQLPVTRQQAMTISPQFVTRWAEEILSLDSDEE